MVCISSEKHDERTHRGSRKRYKRTHWGSAKTLRTNPPGHTKTLRTNPPGFGKTLRTNPPGTRKREDRTHRRRRERQKCPNEPNRRRDAAKIAERTQILEPPPARADRDKTKPFLALRSSELVPCQRDRTTGVFCETKPITKLGDCIMDAGRRQNCAERTHRPNDGHRRKCAERTHRGLRGVTTSPDAAREKHDKRTQRGLWKRNERTHGGSGKDDERTHRSSGERYERSHVVWKTRRTNPPDERPKWETRRTNPASSGGLTGSPGVVSIEAKLPGIS